MSPLHVGVFRGIVLEGSSDAERSDELLVCDQYELGPRGQLVVASDLTAWGSVSTASGSFVTRLYALEPSVSPSNPRVVYCGDGGPGVVVIGAFDPLLAGVVWEQHYDTPAPVDGTFGWQSTIVTMPYVAKDGEQKRIALVAVGARSYQLPVSSPGLFVLEISEVGAVSMHPIYHYDALGTGEWHSYPTPPINGTMSVQMKPRGIFSYHGHVFLWGYDAHDTAFADGPNRLMFSNIGNPLKYGNDPDDVAVPPLGDPTYVDNNHAYADSDAILIGGAGEAIRAACVWSGRAFIATNNGLYFVEGYGRESFLTNGAVPIRRSAGVVGPHALIEGPDAQLHGCDELGHWTSDGTDTVRPGLRLIDYASHSRGYWDLIWTDPSRPDGWPGKSNEDLVWMLSVRDWQQVWIVIPFCNATLGYGPGFDTVVIKYHCATDGYTRQIFYNRALTAGTNLVRELSTQRAQIIGASFSLPTIWRYAYKATPLSSPIMPVPLPTVKFGEYAIYGPDGEGVYAEGALTLAWEKTASLPLSFVITPTVDGVVLPSVRLTVGAVTPVGAATGDLWIDTSGTDANLGNAGGGPLVDASPADYIMKRYVAPWNKWVVLGGGQQGTRVTTPVTWEPTRGTRLKLELACTAAAGRFHVEGIAFEPSAKLS